MYANDEGWDKPIVPKKKAEVRGTGHTALQPSLLCNLGGVQVLFVDVANSWNNLGSVSAMVRINGLMDINNATVSYGDAFIPYIKCIAKRYNHMLAETPPVSVYIGPRVA